MRPLGLLASVLCASLLVGVPALAQGAHRTATSTASATGTTVMDGTTVRVPQRVSLLERTSGYHLPTYMMHLYRNFRANFSSRPLDVVEREAVKQQADTVKSLVAKSKMLLVLFFNFIFCSDFTNTCMVWDVDAGFFYVKVFLRVAAHRGCQSCVPDDLRGFQSTSCSGGGMQGSACEKGPGLSF